MTAATTLARAWVGCYTGWVEAEASERRREEIESDLWEQRADARAGNASPSAVEFSIAGRVIAGIPADLLWVHTQRLAARGRPEDRKARLMTAFGRLAATWWWTVPAAVLSSVYVWMGIGNLMMPGIPYLDGAIQAFVLAALMLAGIALLHFAPRLAGSLAVAGGLTGIALWWAPLIQVFSVAVTIGATLAVLRHTTGPVARALAGVGLLVVGTAPLAFVSGTPSSLSTVQVIALVAALVGAALLAASGRTTPRVATA